METVFVVAEARTWGTKRLVTPPVRARALRPPFNPFPRTGGDEGWKKAPRRAGRPQAGAEPHS